MAFPSSTGIKKQALVRVIHYAQGLVLVFLVLLPILPLFFYSISGNWRFPSILPQNINMEGWLYVLQGSKRVLNALGNSLLITALVLVMSLILGIPAGRVLGLHRFRFRMIIQFCIYLPFLVPPLAVVIGMHILFIRLSLADRLIGVVLSHMVLSLPYIIISMHAIFSNYNLQYEQVAQTLGCRPMQRFFRITLPLIRPGIISGSIFIILVSWNQYILSLLIGGGRVLTLPVLLLVFVSAGDFVLGGVVSIIFMLPVLILFVLSSKLLNYRMFLR